MTQQSNQPTSPDNGLDPNYVTGLCEGLASFTYARNGNGINLRFAIRVQEQDRALLFSLMRFFGVGNIYHSTQRQEAPSGRGGIWYYCVTKTSELDTIAKHFERYPLAGSRTAVFLVWRNMLDLKRIPRKADPDTLSLLATRLSELSRRRPSANTARTVNQ
ncbi:MAG: LAGLIDADG family homing endonuclease [Elusimicrobia bacterium]|nr:LAGLIDADG family homing endonuclease [Elusimicrobiota bacterium]